MWFSSELRKSRKIKVTQSFKFKAVQTIVRWRFKEISYFQGSGNLRKLPRRIEGFSVKKKKIGDGMERHLHARIIQLI